MLESLGIKFHHKIKPCVLSPAWRSFKKSCFFNTHFRVAKKYRSKLAKSPHNRYTVSLGYWFCQGKLICVKSFFLQKYNLYTILHFLPFFGQVAQKLTKIKISLQWGGFKAWASNMLLPDIQRCYAKKNQRFISYT